MLRPTLLVGLGDPGAEVARGVVAVLDVESRDLARLTGGMVLTASGMHSLRTIQEARPEPEPPDPAAGAPDAPAQVPSERVDDGDGEAHSAARGRMDPSALLDAGNPGSEPPPGGAVAGACPETYPQWHQFHLARGREMEALLLGEARHVRNQGAVALLEQRGCRVSELLHVLVVAPCFDAVGSTALRVVLEVLDDLFCEALAELPHEIQLILIAPDQGVGGPGGEAAAYARSYACVQELEAVLEGTGGCRRVPIDSVWLCSSRNSADYFLEGGAEVVSRVIAHAVEVVRGAPATEPASSPATRQRVFGRATRYSAFGEARLWFPRDELLAAAREVAVGEELRVLPELQDGKLPVATAFAMVGRFASEHLEELGARLSVTADRGPIFCPFDASALDGRGAALISRLQARQAEYSELDRQMQEDLDARNQALSAAVETALGDQVQQLTRDSGAGGLARAQAWLAAAGGDPGGHRRYIVGEADAYSDDTIPAVIERSWVERLEERFASLVFHDSELVRACLDEKPELRRNRRKLLRQAREDIASRSRQLEDHLAERARLEAQVRADAPEGAEPEGQAEENVSAERDSGPVESLNRRVTRQALESETAILAELSADLERLHLLCRDLEPQIKEMDRVIRDPVERRRLFQRIEEADRHQASLLSDEYLGLEIAHAGARAGLDAASSRLRLGSVLAGGAVLVLTAATALQFRHAGLTALVSALTLAAAAWWIWTGPRARYDRARGEEKTAREACMAARGRLLAHWDTLACDRFSDRVSAVAADWSTWVPERILAWNEKLERFRDAVTAAQDHARDLTEWRPQPECFVVTLFPPDGARGIVREQAGELRARFDNYWQGHPVAEFARAYLGGKVSLENLIQELRLAADEAFAKLRGMSVEAYFETVADAQVRQRVVDRVLRAAAPLARGVARPHDPATELTYVALSEPPGRSVVAKALADLGQRSMHHRQSPSDTTATLSRVMVGYAAFQLAVLREARGYFLQHELEQRRAFYAEPGRIDTLPDLMPVSGPGVPVAPANVSARVAAPA